MGHAKIFHNYPESFMVVVSFSLIQKALDEVLRSVQIEKLKLQVLSY